jgi:hypothetical protein
MPAETAVATAPEQAASPASTQTSTAPASDTAVNDPFKSLDSKLNQPPKEPPAEKKDDKAADPKPGEKTDLKTAVPVKDAPEHPKVLRERAKKFEDESKTLRQEVQSLKARIESADRSGTDTKALTERLGAVEKERDELRGKLRSVSFQTSDEYQKQYEQPFSDASEYAKQAVEQLTVIEGEDPATGEPKRRQAKWDDFAYLYSLPIGKAISESKRMFGDVSSFVEGQLMQLQKLDRSRFTARQSEEKSWKEKSTAEQAQEIQRREAYDGMRSKIRTDLATKVPWYSDGPEDSEFKSLRDEGYQIFDAKPQTPAEAAVKVEHIRHRTAAFPVVIRKLQLAEEKLKDAEATIAELKGSGPGKTRTSGSDDGTAHEKSVAEELREAMNGA